MTGGSFCLLWPLRVQKGFTSFIRPWRICQLAYLAVFHLRSMATNKRPLNTQAPKAWRITWRQNLRVRTGVSVLALSGSSCWQPSVAVTVRCEAERPAIVASILSARVCTLSSLYLPGSNDPSVSRHWQLSSLVFGYLSATGSVRMTCSHWEVKKNNQWVSTVSSAHFLQNREGT